MNKWILGARLKYRFQIATAGDCDLVMLVWAQETALIFSHLRDAKAGGLWNTFPPSGPQVNRGPRKAH